MADVIGSGTATVKAMATASHLRNNASVRVSHLKVLRDVFFLKLAVPAMGLKCCGISVLITKTVSNSFTADVSGIPINSTLKTFVNPFASIKRWHSTDANNLLLFVFVTRFVTLKINLKH